MNNGRPVTKPELLHCPHCGTQTCDHRVETTTGMMVFECSRCTNAFALYRGCIDHPASQPEQRAH